MTKIKLKQLIEESAIEQQSDVINLKENSLNGDYIRKLMKLNPKWNPEDAIKDFGDQFDSDDEQDEKEHREYMANAEEWIKNLIEFKPGVKIGDWVKVHPRQMQGNVKWTIGRIEAESQMQGHDYGESGYKGPSIIPAWDIRVFMEDVHDFYNDKEPNIYVFAGGKIYYNSGIISYAQHDEIQSNSGVETYKTYKKENTFTRLSAQNFKMQDIK
jgi:hypothetical protein